MKTIRSLSDVLASLHARWQPHEGQKPVGRALFHDQILDLFIEAGRNWGKTEFVSYVLWRWAISHPGSENYYFAPFMKQAREILWSSRRMQSFGPSDWLHGSPNDSQMRMQFQNGSFIKLDGSDNVEAYRGVKPKGITIFDEFKDFRPEFYEAYDPNRAAHDAPLIIIGTPPESDGQFTEVADFFKKHTKKRYFWAPSEQNPYLSREWLKAKKEELYARSEGDVWEREYMARRVRGGKRSIFPMLSRELHCKPRHHLLQELRHDLFSLEWFTAVDPGTVSTFAMLVLAINPYTRQVYVFDELYEQSIAHTSTSKIMPSLMEKEDLCFPCEPWQKDRRESCFLRTCDEAAAWFMSEALDRYQVSFQPTQKALNKKESGLSLIKDLLLHEKITIASECVHLFSEMENYVRDDQGRIPKINDHLIDCLRYALGAAHYSAVEKKAPEDQLARLDPRLRRLALEQKDLLREDEESFGVTTNTDLGQTWDDAFKGDDSNEDDDLQFNFDQWG